MPSLPKGRHTIEVNIDTKRLGTVSARREFLVDDPTIATLRNLYTSYVEDGATAKAAQTSKQLLAKRFAGVTRPGEAIALNQLAGARGSLPRGYSASVKWYPGARSLRAVVQVKNPYYRLRSLERLISRASLQLNVCASGTGGITSFYVRPTPDGKASVYNYGSSNRRVSAGKWKSFEGGYVVDVELPYDSIECFDKTWKQMAVMASLTALAPDCQWDNVTPCCAPGAPPSTATYRLLTRK